MSALLNVIVPVLGIKDMTFGDVREYAVKRFGDLVKNAVSFPGLAPTTAQLATQITSYDTALSNWRPGVKATTLAKYTERRKLEVMLYQMAWCCANISDNNQQLFSLSGFKLKRKGSPHNKLDAPTDFNFTDGPLPGTLMAVFKGVDFKHAYEVRISSSPDIMNEWIAVVIDSSSPILIPELKSGVRYYGFVRTMGARGVMSPPSNIAMRICQ